jgi:hypothetical protein
VDEDSELRAFVGPEERTSESSSTSRRIIETVSERPHISRLEGSATIDEKAGLAARFSLNLRSIIARRI